jgi:mycothiol synthase
MAEKDIEVPADTAAVTPLPAGYSVRWATLDDLPEVVRMFDASDATYGLAPGMDIEMFRQLYGVPGFEPERNTFLIFAADGELAGYGDTDEQLGEAAVTTFGRIHPNHLGKGLGGWLFRRLQTRAIEIAAGRPLALRATTLAHDDRAVRLFEMLDYNHVRDFWHMERSLEDLPPIAAPGVTIRAFSDRDARSFHRIETDAFRGSGGSRRCRSRTGRSFISTERPFVASCGF